MNQTTSILNQKLTISENALSTQVNGEIVILHYESEYYYTLNAVGTKFWQLFTELKNVDTVIQQLVQIYSVNETTLRHDVTEFVEELVEEELLNCENQTDERNLVTVDKIKELLQPQQQDNRLPYEAPLLRKHGKVSAGTNTTFQALDIDGLSFFTDLS
ncbi:MAG: PqqD family protein [Rivularia sp. (in: Bacteria)]|nr:PqqD family protein [Rivularia sp. MS3]